MDLADDKTSSFIHQQWESTITPTLAEYIKIPSQSPMFDAECLTNGLQEKVLDMFVAWADNQKLSGYKLEVLRLPQRTPLIFIEIAATAGGLAADDATVLLYGIFFFCVPLSYFHALISVFVFCFFSLFVAGHADKQPPMTETWSDGLGPCMYSFMFLHTCHCKCKLTKTREKKCRHSRHQGWQVVWPWRGRRWLRPFCRSHCR
jgi:hypothetical protein